MIKFTLSENDYFQYLLYVTSTDKMTKKYDFNKRIGFFIFYGIILLAFIKKELYDMVILFCFFILTDIVLYPSREKKTKFNYLRDVAKNREAHRTNKVFTVILNKDSLEIFDFFGEEKRNINGIEEIVEIGKYFYILFVNSCLIIPKSEINNIEDLKDKLLLISKENNVGFKSDLNWKW